MSRAKKVILERQLKVRASLWPGVSDAMLWDGDGFAMVPRTMPLMMDIMDGLAGKGIPVGHTYLEMWCRLLEEKFLTLNHAEMAFHAGFTGQRAVRTWKERVYKLIELGFIDARPGPSGDLSYAIFLNPYHVIKRAYLAKKVAEAKWQALVIRALEIKALDLDQIDDEGRLISPDVEDQDQEEEGQGGEPKVGEAKAKRQRIRRPVPTK